MFLNILSLLRFLAVIFKFLNISCQTSWRFLESIRLIYKVGSGSRRFYISFSENRWQGDNSSRRVIYNINIIGDMRTNLVDFFPFFSLSLGELSPRFVSVSPMSYYRKLENKCVNPSRRFHDYPRCFTMKRFIN